MSATRTTRVTRVTKAQPAAEKQHLDKYAESVQAPLAAPRRQNEREAEKINSLRAELAPVTEDKDAVIESLRADKDVVVEAVA